MWIKCLFNICLTLLTQFQLIDATKILYTSFFIKSSEVVLYSYSCKQVYELNK